MIRVLLAEDSFVMREGLVRILEAAEDIDVLGVFDDAERLREAIDADPPDVVVTDIRMPPTHTDEGIRLATELRATHPEVGVVVLSQHAEPVYALALFAESIDRRAYLLKERVRDGHELQRAVRDVADGGAAVDSRIVEELLRSRTNGADGRLETLSDREREILRLLAEGRSNHAIAAEVGITTRSVEHSINAIFSKLGLQRSDDVNRRVKAALLYLSGTDG